MVAINAHRTAHALFRTYSRTGALLAAMQRIIWMHEFQDRCGEEAWIEVLGAVLALQEPAGRRVGGLVDPQPGVDGGQSVVLVADGTAGKGKPRRRRRSPPPDA